MLEKRIGKAKVDNQSKVGKLNTFVINANLTSCLPVILIAALASSSVFVFPMTYLIFQMFAFPGSKLSHTQFFFPFR